MSILNEMSIKREREMRCIDILAAEKNTVQLQSLMKRSHEKRHGIEVRSANTRVSRE